MFYKSGPGAWRQIVRLTNHDLCWVLKQTDNLPFVNSVKQIYSKQFPNMPQRCPVEVGKYYTENVTLSDSSGSYDLARTFTTGEMPNGVYRHVIKLHNKKDPTGFMLFWQTQIYNKMGENNF